MTWIAWLPFGIVIALILALIIVCISDITADCAKWVYDKGRRIL